MMIGPSAPNGPPVPIEIADDSGLSTATLRIHAAAADQDGLDRLGNAVAADLLGAEARHQPDDECRRAPAPATIQGPATASAGETLAKEKRPNHDRLVASAISFTRSQAAPAPPASDDDRHADEERASANRR